MTLEEWAESVADGCSDFGTAAFHAGHWPNPLGHSFVGCRVCAIAEAARTVADLRADEVGAS